ncbi:hypothetical protein CANMA_001878 [Candida margitis]|uniref:uncharacterized protein n=1 Tax=Candida margitis TaxID=1775924 RepID=UPI0022274B08|nr:uncharacterized protein CANMA_001878 [Candida margitis]KAI5969074.1 hypothetical protein CANMA_001878 [Candida margitis]
MGLSSILQQIEKRGKLPNKSTSQIPQNEVKETKPSGGFPRSGANGKSIDPVVARLKEKRRLEREQAEAAKAKQNGNKSKKSTLSVNPSSRTTASSGSSSTQRPRQSAKKATQPEWNSSPPPPAPAKKKLNFSALMKKANEIDSEKLSIKFPQKSKSPEPTAPKPFSQKSATISRKPVTATKAPNGFNQLHKKQDTVRSKPLPNARPEPPIRKALPKVPIPARQPNAKIQQRLKQRQFTNSKSRGYGYNEEEDDDDLGDFLASEDEEEGAAEDEYNRDEIWAMFNKGKKRKYYEYNDYDDEDDDMEATGADVLEEEMRSRLDAEREDRREMEEEKRRALEKQRKKMRQ